MLGLWGEGRRTPLWSLNLSQLGPVLGIFFTSDMSTLTLHIVM